MTQFFWKFLKLPAQIFGLLIASIYLKWLVWWILAGYVLILAVLKSSHAAFRLDSVAEPFQSKTEDRPSYVRWLAGMLVALILLIIYESL